MRTTLLLAFIYTLSCVNSQGTCPDGWTKYKDEKCYLLRKAYSNFADAKEACESMTTTLAYVKEEEQQLFLTNHIFETSEVDIGVWIGGTRMANSLTDFQWEDGTPFEYTNWAVGSPTELDGRNCVQMLSNFTLNKIESQGTWRDTSCNSPLYFVCEMDPEWTVNEIRLALIETRKKLEEKIKNPVPIGYIYTQFSEHPVPSTLWPDVTWTEVTSQFAGKFFRAAGGNAAEFGQTQNADSPRLSQFSLSSFPTGPAGTATIIPGTWSDPLYSGPSHSGDTPVFVNRFFVTNAEVRPINTAIRIWKRLA